MRTAIIDIETMPEEYTPELIAEIEAIDSNDAAAAMAEKLGVAVGQTKDYKKIVPKLLENKSGLNTNKLIIACIGVKLYDQQCGLGKKQDETTAEPLETFGYKTAVLWNEAYLSSPDLYTPREGEKMLLQQFADLMRPYHVARWVGHNAKGFDMPAIWKRGVKYGIKWIVETMPHDKWGESCDDTMQMWGGTNYQEKTKLEAIADFLDIPYEKGMDGSKVYETIKAGDIDKITKYCTQDVELCCAIYKRIKVIGDR